MSRVFPLTLALSPNTKNVLGEREQIVGTLTQGGISEDDGPYLLPLMPALGYRPTPRWGSIGKKRPPAASQMSNLEIPAPRFRGGRLFAGMTCLDILNVGTDLRG